MKHKLDMRMSGLSCQIRPMNTIHAHFRNGWSGGELKTLCLMIPLITHQTLTLGQLYHNHLKVYCYMFAPVSHN